MVLCLHSQKKLVLQPMRYTREMDNSSLYNPSWIIFVCNEHLTEERRNNIKQSSVVSAAKIGPISMYLVKHYVVKSWEEDKVSRCLNLGTTLRGVAGFRHLPEDSLTGCLVGPGACLNTLENREISCSYQDSNHRPSIANPLTQSLYRRSCTDCCVIWKACTFLPVICSR